MYTSLYVTYTTTRKNWFLVESELLIYFCYLICMILVTLSSLLCMSVFHIRSLSLVYILLITATTLVLLFTLWRFFSIANSLKVNIYHNGTQIWSYFQKRGIFYILYLKKILNNGEKSFWPNFKNFKFIFTPFYKYTLRTESYFEESKVKLKNICNEYFVKNIKKNTSQRN